MLLLVKLSCNKQHYHMPCLPFLVKTAGESQHLQHTHTYTVNTQFHLTVHLYKSLNKQTNNKEGTRFAYSWMTKSNDNLMTQQPCMYHWYIKPLYKIRIASKSAAPTQKLTELHLLCCFNPDWQPIHTTVPFSIRVSPETQTCTDSHRL